ncbi:hypothetical protein [Planctomicrobium sp. SH527]|uniref:hypothetical protein n=1 Tax=Planctomicrobium sp. SH527 TaxID=3448123 RepID=UPI003F5BEACD
MTEFPCPHCQIPLRIRDESYRNRVIPCPDCSREVLICDVNGKLAGVTPPNHPAPSKPLSELRPQRRWGAPQFIACGVALLLIGGIAFIAIERKPAAPAPDVPEPTPDSNQSNVTPNTPAADSKTTTESPPVDGMPSPPMGTGTQANPNTAVAKTDNPPEEASPEGQQLKSIGVMINGALSRDQQFPAGISAPPNSGWSWIATLADTHFLQGPRRRIDAGWDAPVNEEYVRRTFPPFLNAAIPQLAGDDNFPTTHYVGIAGTGTAPGIFRDNQITKPANIKDGLSQTMMVAGVSKQLGSWARPGNATTRAFTQEPFINGPDGFSTGQADQMTVLMADGSVRVLSQKTDPTVIRQLAAMSDGHPQKPEQSVTAVPPAVSAPVAPAASPLMTPAMPPAPASVAEQQDAPITVPLIPERPKVDLKARLNQKLLGFEQNQPTPLEDLLFDVQELLGVKIDLSKLPPETRKNPVTISLKATTVGDVLREIADSAKVGYAIHESHIEIQPK